jgi:hypothetical protein
VRVMIVCGVVMALFFGYMFVSALESVGRANDAVDLVVARYAR